MELLIPRVYHVEVGIWVDIQLSASPFVVAARETTEYIY